MTEQSKKEIRKPECVINYNLLAKGVDKNNQMVSFYFLISDLSSGIEKYSYTKLKYVL
jgi:hypothetical protein